MEENNQVEQEILPTETTPESTEEGKPTDVPSYIELDPKSKYKYGDLEFTADELKQSYLRQSDYTKKTQEIAKEREYIANLQYDLDAVKRNPSLISQFKQIYPQKFHNYLRYVSEQTSETEKPSINPEIEQKLAKYDSYFQKMEAEATQKEVDAAFDKYMKKYPLAHEASVVSTVQNYWNQKKQKALSEGQDPSSLKMTDQEWEQIFKSVHLEIEKLYQTHNKNKFEKQRDVSQRLKDVPSGGGVPGQKPNNPRSIKEVKEQMLRDLVDA